MKIKIPNEYLYRYSKGKIFVSRWPKNSFILMNIYECNELVGSLKRLTNNTNTGLLKFFEAGIFECPICEEEIDLPELLCKSMHHKKMIFNEEKQGLIMSFNK